MNIQEYLKKRMKILEYELGYYEDSDEGNNLHKAKEVLKEIKIVKKLTIPVVIVPKGTLCCVCEKKQANTG